MLSSLAGFFVPAVRRTQQIAPRPGCTSEPSRASHRCARRLFFYACMAVALFLAWRLYDVQVIKGALYASEALAQRSDTVEVFARRGSILDRNGNVLGALVAVARASTRFRAKSPTPTRPPRSSRRSSESSTPRRSRRCTIGISGSSGSRVKCRTKSPQRVARAGPGRRRAQGRGDGLARRHRGHASPRRCSASSAPTKTGSTASSMRTTTCCAGNRAASRSKPTSSDGRFHLAQSASSRRRSRASTSS